MFYNLFPINKKKTKKNYCLVNNFCHNYIYIYIVLIHIYPSEYIQISLCLYLRKLIDDQTAGHIKIINSRSFSPAERDDIWFF